MALAAAVAGATRPAQEISWLAGDGSPVNLSGATLTGKIRDRQGAIRSIAGTLSVTDAAGGVFVWSYDAADVATAGLFDVQFTAAFSSPPSPSRTLISAWLVNPSL